MYLLLLGTTVRRVKFVIKLFSSSVLHALLKHSGKHEANAGKLCLLIVTPDLFLLPVKERHFTTTQKEGGFLKQGSKKFSLTLKSAAF